MKGKILVIEDNPIWQRKFKKFLELDGFFVEIVSNPKIAIEKIQTERFHFITIDMQLNEKNKEAKSFEGWDILELIKKFRVQAITPVMVITGYGAQYNELKATKKVESLFFMEKGEFDRQKFLEIINKQVEKIDLRFKDDHRGD